LQGLVVLLYCLLELFLQIGAEFLLLYRGKYAKEQVLTLLILKEVVEVERDLGERFELIEPKSKALTQLLVFPKRDTLNGN